MQKFQVVQVKILCLRISPLECLNDYGSTILSTQSNIIVTYAFLAFVLNCKPSQYFVQCSHKKSDHITLPQVLQL